MYGQISGDYGDIAAQIDKIIRMDDEASGVSYRSALSDRSGVFEEFSASSEFPSLQSAARTPRTPPVYVDRGVAHLSPAFDASDMQCSTYPSMNMGDGESTDWIGGGYVPKDIRQVRLFKTRICSYGDECQYLKKGRCLFAHSRDEVRVRPPPPPPSPAIVKRSPMRMSPDRTRTISLNQILLNQNVPPQVFPADNSCSVWSSDYHGLNSRSNETQTNRTSETKSTGIYKSLFEELFS